MINRDYEYIKKFQKISIPRICDRLGINYKNVSGGRTTEDKYKKVKILLENELAKLYIIDEEDYNEE